MKSVIQTHQEPVIVKHFDESLNSYGQKHVNYTERTAHMYLTKYTQTIESDVRFNDVVLIGITHDQLYDNENVIYKGKEYKVTHTIEAVGPIHWNQVFLSIYEQ